MGSAHGSTAAGRARPSADRAPAEYPTTVQQRRMLDFLGGRVDAHYLNVESFVLRGPLDGRALKAALAGVVGRHDMIRSVYPAHGRTYRVLPPSDGVLDAIVRTRQAVPTVEDAVRDGMAWVGSPMALDREPPLRVWVARIDAETSVLLLSGHYLVFDAWSFMLLYEDLTAEYQRIRCGGSERPQPAQYRDAPPEPPQPGEPSLGRLFDRGYAAIRSLSARTPGRTGPAATVERTWAGLTPGLVAAAKAYRVTPYVLGAVALLRAVADTLGTPQPFAGSAYAGRTTPQAVRAIGYFATTLFVGLDLSAAATPAESVRDVDAQLRTWYAMPRVQWETVLEDHGGTDLYPVKFAFFPNSFARPGPLLAGLTTERLRPPPAVSARRPLHLITAYGDDGVTASLTYRTDVVGGDLPQGLLARFGQQLAELGAQPDPTPTEREQR
ncbi:MAG: hypothetical protein HY241_09555 [Actinobacteria bacterium]|nr:hypothetical protein [Actinomycetota bacterium]